MDILKIGICTLYGNYNFGNKLQNYALQEIIKQLGYQVTTFRLNNNNVKGNIYNFFNIRNHKTDIRTKKFISFNKNIIYSKNKINIYYPFIWNKIDVMIYGSDQVWNPYYGGTSKLLSGDYGKFKKIAYAASFGVSNISEMNSKIMKKGLEKFDFISLREEAGKKIIEKLTGRKDIEVLVDPTMLLTSNEWDKVSNKPKQLEKIKNKKYILNYFLGELSKSQKKEIDKISKEYDCEIINLLDKRDPFYVCGPSEFLYLEKNAFLICTDSFHSSVFAILYDRPFVIFDREQKGIENMNSRIDTLINKFKLKNRRYNGKNITKDNLNHDYTEAYKILEKERIKSEDFLKKALDIE